MKPARNQAKPLSPIARKLRILLGENEACAAKLDEASLTRFLAEVQAAKRVFVLGEGRSGLVMRMFAMRLMHAGMIVFVAGETTTPAIASGDCIIACSGSGETPVTCLLAEAAIKCGATLVALTTAPESRLARIASLVLMIPAPSKQSCMPGADVSAARGSVQFAGSLFEQQALLVCDALCLALAEAAHLDRATMWSRHANIE